MSTPWPGTLIVRGAGSTEKRRGQNHEKGTLALRARGLSGGPALNSQCP